MSSLFFILCAVVGVCSAGGIVPSLSAPESSNTNPPTILGFDYIGNVEGKIYLKAQLPTNLTFGVEWLAALQICANAGYRMASVTSQAQDDLVKAYVTGSGPDSKNWMWIDGTNFASGNLSVWYSLHSGRQLEFFNWVRDRPVSPPVPGVRNCLRWSSNSFDAGWWDVDCNDRHNVLCEDVVNKVGRE